MTHWKDLEVFIGVDLEDSAVLRWSLLENALVIEVEGSLLPSHHSYEKPLPGSRACYKPARLVFPFPAEVLGLLSMSEAERTESPGGAPNYGTILGLSLKDDARYRVSGEFGEIAVQSMAVRFEITSQRQCAR